MLLPSLSRIHVRDGQGVCILHGCASFFFQAEDGIRDLVRSRGLGDVYKRQGIDGPVPLPRLATVLPIGRPVMNGEDDRIGLSSHCLLYTSDAADERSSVDLGGRRIIKKQTHDHTPRASQALSTLMSQQQITLRAIQLSKKKDERK